jgi:hypothetical protein
MITSDGELLYGSFFNDFSSGTLNHSEIFTAVQKLVHTIKYFYFLENGMIYCGNYNKCDNEYQKISCTIDNNVQFIDINVSLYSYHTDYIYATSVHEALYHVSGTVATKLPCIVAQNIYTGRNSLILRKNINEYHYLGYAPSLIGRADRVHIINGCIILLKEKKIICDRNYDSICTKTMNCLVKNIDLLYNIPNGSNLKFLNNNRIFNKPDTINDDIVCVSLFNDNKIIMLCNSTENVYCVNDLSNLHTISELKHCLLDRLTKTNRGQRTKNANKNI